MIRLVVFATLALLICVVIVAVKHTGADAQEFTTAQYERQQRERDDAAAFITRFGAPDADLRLAETTLRALVYEREHVTAVFDMDKRWGNWRLMAMNDSRSNKTLNPDEAKQRLRARDTLQ